MYRPIDDIIAIHGVGNATPGSLITPLSTTMSSPSSVSSSGSLVVDGVTYPTLSNANSARFLEVDWSDINNPGPGPLNLIFRGLTVLLAVVYLGDRWQGASQSSRRVTPLFRFLLEGLMFWSITIPPFTLLLTCTQLPSKIAATALLVFSMGVISFAFRRHPLFMWAGFGWTGLLGSIAVHSIWYDTLPPLAILGKTYTVIQLGTAALLIASSIEVVLSHRKAAKRWHVRLTRVAYLYIPVLAVAIAGPLLVAVAATIVSYGDGTYSVQREKWCEEFSTGFGRFFEGDVFTYNFFVAEVVMTLSVSLCGLVAIVGIVPYLIARSGRVARWWLMATLVACPLILIMNAVVIQIMSQRIGDVLVQGEALLYVYRISALRALPFVPLFFGPFGVLSHVIGDIVLYVLPDSHPASIRAKSRNRLDAILSASEGTEGTRILFAHSQGTVIAVDTLASRPDSSILLITLGSPIDALYSAFLDIQPGSELTEHARSRWCNLFRRGDYIGGPIPGSSSNRCIGEGGHINYWSDENMNNAVLEFLSTHQSRKPETTIVPAG